MNYLISTITELNQLREKKIAIELIPEQIEALEIRFGAIRAARTDGDPVSGGTNRREEMLLENISKRDDLRDDLEATKREVDALERALQVLTEKERTILQRFYINREKNAAERLAGELGYERAHIYRMKDEALIKLTRALHGQVKL